MEDGVPIIAILQHSSTPSPQSSSHGYGLTAVDDQGVAGDERRFVGN